jgi:hypothetical protein
MNNSTSTTKRHRVSVDADPGFESKVRLPEAVFVDVTQIEGQVFATHHGIARHAAVLGRLPAQATEFLLSAMEILSALDALDAQETRLTVLMFAAGDPTATASMVKTCRALGDRADYLLVKNPARFRNQSFDDCALADLFQRNRVPVIEPAHPNQHDHSGNGRPRHGLASSVC